MSDHEPYDPGTYAGATGDVESTDDLGYVEQEILGLKPAPRRYAPLTAAKVAEIEQVLAERIHSTEGKTAIEAMGEYTSDRRNCPLCSNYSHYNVYLLSEHIAAHREVAEFYRAVNEERQRYEALQRRKSDLRNKLAAIRQEFIAVSDSLESFDVQGLADRERQYSRLLRLLPPRFGAYRSFSTSVKA